MEEARTYNRAGNKKQALRCLRKRKLVERRITELQNKQDNIQGILERISAAETDRKVVSAYQMGVSALKQALKDVTLEKAESIVDQIQEYCDLQDDLSQTLSSVTDAECLESCQQCEITRQLC
ncbi:charged multivesicular body protein 7-like isoform X2 [Xenopus laevis]|uniref:Charged multivesicular body protein 7-like isoform X2 n=1 Tax=Xenopus laevis TaxID=8355 RepID=A0A8J1MM65_XENLA|nr:charged multivesicular body protein 7-like isoform X2 [Xenopus laevis]